MSVIIETAPQAPVADVPRKTWRRFLQHRVGVVGFGMLAVAVFVAVFAPFIAPYDPYAPVNVTIFDIYQPPSPAHILGTDDGGKDVYSSLLYGARVSLTVGFAAVLLSQSVGITLGMLAGHYGGWVDGFLMRITDAMMCFPSLGGEGWRSARAGGRDSPGGRWHGPGKRGSIAWRCRERPSGP